MKRKKCIPFMEKQVKWSKSIWGDYPWIIRFERFTWLINCDELVPIQWIFIVIFVPKPRKLYFKWIFSHFSFNWIMNFQWERRRKKKKKLLTIAFTSFQYLKSAFNFNIFAIHFLNSSHVIIVWQQQLLLTDELILLFTFFSRISR